MVHEIIALLIQEGLLSVNKRKYVHEVLVYRLVKLAQEKKSGEVS